MIKQSCLLIAGLCCFQFAIDAQIDRASAGERLVLRTDRASCFAISADGRQVVSGERDGDVRFWNLELGNEAVSPLKTASWVSHLAISQDGELLAAALANLSVELWDLSNRKLLRSDTENRSVTAVTFLPGGNHWLTATGSTDGRVRTWDRREPGTRLLFDQRTSPLANDVLIRPRVPNVYQLCLDRTGTTAAIALWSGVVLVDVSKGNEKAALQVDGTAAIAVDMSDDERLAIGMGSGAVRVYASEFDKTICKLEVGGSLSTLALSRNGKWLAIGLNGDENKMNAVIEIYNVEEGARVKSFKCHSEEVEQIQFTSHGELVTCGSDVIRVWSLDLMEK